MRLHCRGVSGDGGAKKSKAGEERAKLSTGLGWMTGIRQNIPPNVIGATHGYRSEQSTGRLQGNSITPEGPGYS